MGRSRGTGGRAAPCPAVAVIVALFLLGGCSSARHSAAGPGNVLNVTERDFRISVAPTHEVAHLLAISRGAATFVEPHTVGAAIT